MGQVDPKQEEPKCNRFILGHLCCGVRSAFIPVAMPVYSMKYSRRAARAAFLGFLLLLVSRAFADDSKISPDLQPLLANSSNQINVIVQYKTPPQTSGGLLGAVVGVFNLVGGVLKTVFSLIPAVSATLH